MQNEQKQINIKALLPGPTEQTAPFNSAVTATALGEGKQGFQSPIPHAVN